MTPDPQNTQPIVVVSPDQTTTVTKTVAPATPIPETHDRVFLTLLAATVFFALVAVAVSKWSPNDGQTFQMICGLTTGFAGACLGRVKPAAQSATNTTTTTAGPAA